MVAAKFAHGRPGPAAKDTGGSTSISRPRAAKLLGVGESAVGKARKVRREGVPELAKAVEGGDLTVDEAAKIADLPKAKHSMKC